LARRSNIILLGSLYRYCHINANLEKELI
jgi:hypothetical protein